MTTTNLDAAVNDNPFLRAGLDAWCFGVSTSMLLGLRTLRLVSDAQVRVLSALTEPTAAASTAGAAVSNPAPSSRDHELLEAVLPQDNVRDSPLRMYSGSRDVVPWRFDNK